MLAGSAGRRRLDRARFSLLEVLVAFVILSLVATALFRLFSGAFGMCRRPTTTAAPCWSPRACSPRPPRPARCGRRRRPAPPTTGGSPGRRRSRHRPLPAIRRTSSARRRRCRTPLPDHRGSRVPVAGRRHSANSRSRRRASARGMRNDRRTRCAAGKGPSALARSATVARGGCTRMASASRRMRGFTLIELMLALMLMAGIAAMLFGSLYARGAKLGRRRGEGRTGFRHAATAVVPAHPALRAYPQRMRGVVEIATAVCRRARRDPLCSGAARARRAAAASTTFASPSCAPARSRSSCRNASFPTSAHPSQPEFRDARALGARRRHRGAQGSPISAATPGASDADEPTWRDRWDDKQRPPLLVRFDVKTVKGATWPTLVVEPRRGPGGRLCCLGPGTGPLREGRQMSVRRNLRSCRRQSGIALIAVLWLTVLVTVIASSFAYSMRGEALAARNLMSLAQARAAADGAVERTAFELARPARSPDAWNADGQPHAWNDGDIAIVRNGRRRERPDRPQCRPPTRC